MPNATVVLQLQNRARAEIQATTSQVGALSAAEQRAALQILARQRAAARLLQTSSQLATADQRLATETFRTSAAQDRAAISALRLAQAQERAARGGGASSEFIESLKGGLLGIVGPAALATAAIEGVRRVVDSFGQGFALKANLDATNASIAFQVSQFRDYGQAASEAQAFATKYKLTQAELAATMQSGVAVFRLTNASATDTLTTFARLQATAPDKPISEAARAIRELATGDVTSIKELFNVPAKDALAMKNAIAEGQDPIKIVSEYLTRAGAGAELLRIQTEGAVGAMKDLKVAQEELSLAQGEVAQAGIPLMGVQTSATRGLARVMRGELIPSWDELRIKSDTYHQAYMQAVLQGQQPQQAQIAGLLAVANSSGVTTQAFKEQQQAQAENERTAALATGAQKAHEATVNALANALAQGKISLDAYALGMQQLERDANRASVAVAGVQQAALKNSGTVDLVPANATIGSPGSRGNSLDDFLSFIKRQEEAEKAKSEQILRTGSATARVAELERQRAAAVKEFGADSAEAIRAETELRQERERQREAANRGGGTALSNLSAELNVTNDLIAQRDILLAQQARLAAGSRDRLRVDGQLLDINEKIADLQRSTALDIVRNEQAKLKEARELRTNQNIVSGAGFSSEQKRAAELRIQEILLEQQGRDAEIAKAQRQLGGQLPAAPNVTVNVPPAEPQVQVVVNVTPDGRVQGVQVAGAPSHNVVTSVRQVNGAR